MVILTLTPHRGNGARTFPSTGYLGLTPVTLAGVVRTKLQEDNRPIEASSLAVRVRCYESLAGGATGSSNSGSGSGSGSGSIPGAGSTSPSSSSSATSPSNNYANALDASNPLSVTHPQPNSFTEMLRGGSSPRGSVLWERSVTLWSASSPSPSPSTSPSASPGLGLEGSGSGSGSQSHSPSPSPVYGDLGEFHKPWRLVIPPEAVQQGAKSTMIYKTWRIWWALEAVIAHKPAGMHGTRMIRTHHLAFINYAPPPPPSPLEWRPMPTPSPSSSSSSSSVPVECSVTGASTHLGASEPFSLSVHLRRLGHGHGDVPKRVSVELRREITYAQPAESPTTSSYGFDHAHAARQTGPGPGPGRRGSAVAVLQPVRRPHSITPANGTKSRRQSEQLTTETLLSLQHQHQPDSAAISTMSMSTSSLLYPTPSHSSSSSSACQDSSDESSSLAPFLPARSNASASSASLVTPVPSPSRKKREEMVLANFETDVHFDAHGVWNGQVAGCMPKAKSLYHYALGESCTTASASSRFYFVVKVHLRSRNSFIELPHRDIHFMTISPEEREKAREQLSRIAAVQKAEARLFGHGHQRGGSRSPDRNSSTSTSTRKSTVRRRSEQADVPNSPRTRLRFGSVPEPGGEGSTSHLSPILASPSIASISTLQQRPRTATSRRPPSSIPSSRHHRPRSAGGVSVSSASIRSNTSGSSSVHNASFSKLGLASSPNLPSSHSSPQLGRMEDMQAERDENENEKENENENEPPSTLFAHFSGFTLRPNDGAASGPMVVEDFVPPKPGVHPHGHSRSKSKPKPSSHTKTAHPFSYEPPILTSLPLSQPVISSTSNSTESSSASLPRAQPPMSRTVSGASMMLDPMSSSAANPSNSGSLLNIRRKSSATINFFLRRGSRASGDGHGRV